MKPEDQIHYLKRALDYCLLQLSRHEYPGSRETSDEFVTLACIANGDCDERVIRCLDQMEAAALAKPGLQHPGQQPHCYHCPLCGKSRLFEKALGVIGCPVCDAEFIPSTNRDETLAELSWDTAFDTTIIVTTEDPS